MIRHSAVAVAACCVVEQDSACWAVCDAFALCLLECAESELFPCGSPGSTALASGHGVLLGG